MSQCKCEVITHADLLDRVGSTLFGDTESAAVVAAIAQLSERIERDDTECLCCATPVHNHWRHGPRRPAAEFFLAHPASAGDCFIVCAICNRCAGRPAEHYVRACVALKALIPHAARKA